jgi:putative endonuclease
MAFQNRITGDNGEQAASDLLSSKGYRILERNFRSGKAEIDIIARIGNEIVFVEVKTRSNIMDVLPFEIVSAKQTRQIIQAADEYMQVAGQDADSRFDLILVDPTKSPPATEHIEGAFYPFEGF